MQTRQYKDLFALSTHLIGAVALTADEQTQLASFIDRRFFEAFRKSPFWPRYMVYGESRDIISLKISGLGAGSSTDKSSVTNGNYILLGQDSGEISGAAGTNVYYNPAVGTRTSTTISNSTVIFKRSTPNKWVVQDGGQVNISGSKITAVSAGSDILTEADSDSKDNPSEVEIGRASCRERV